MATAPEQKSIPGRPARRRGRKIFAATVGAALVGYGFWPFFAPTGGSAGGATVEVAELREASGLCPSERTADLFWTLNDSGGPTKLYGISSGGRARGEIRVNKARNVDWEALASFRADGRSWLAIGDVGDNLAKRRSCAIYLLEEPSAAELVPGREINLVPARTINFRYEDGPRDCESMFVSAETGEIILLSKRHRPPAIYSLSLAPHPKGGLSVAKRIGRVSHIPQPQFLQKLIPSPGGRYRGQPTDAALSPDGSRVAVLTYGQILLYDRKAGDSWEAVFSNPPRLLPPHHLAVAEGVSFAADSLSVYATGEQPAPRLVRHPLSRD